MSEEIQYPITHPLRTVFTVNTAKVVSTLVYEKRQIYVFLYSSKLFYKSISGKFHCVLTHQDKILFENVVIIYFIKRYYVLVTHLWVGEGGLSIFHLNN